MGIDIRFYYQRDGDKEPKPVEEFTEKDHHCTYSIGWMEGRTILNLYPEIDIFNLFSCSMGDFYNVDWQDTKRKLNDIKPTLSKEYKYENKYSIKWLEKNIDWAIAQPNSDKIMVCID